MAEKRDLAFLLGAGAMKDANLPTAIELTNMVESRVADTYPSLISALRFVMGAIQFGKGCRAESTPSSINIEEFLDACLLLANRESLDVYPFVSAWHERVNQLHALPDEVPSELTQNSFEYLAEIARKGLYEWLRIKDGSQVKHLWNFLDFINAGFRLRIFTLNYDQGVEKALQGVLSEPNKQWTTGFNTEGWYPELLTNNLFDAYVYKLHGSLDWYSDPKLGLCSTQWPAAEDSEGIPEEEPALLIFGTHNKVRAVDPFLSLLFHFQQQLIQSNVLVIVGYGFGDPHINDMIFDALQRDTQMRCLVVNPKPARDLIPYNSPLHRSVGVEERFIDLPEKAGEALHNGSILVKVQELLELQGEEAPF